MVAPVEELDGEIVYPHSGSQDETRTGLVLPPGEDIAIGAL